MKISQILEYPQVISVVANWIYEEWIRHFPNGSITFTESILKTEPDSKTNLPLSFVAIEGRKPFGIARLAKHDMKGREDLSPWLSAVYVPENQRKKGIGKALCGYIVGKASELGYKTLYLYTQHQESFYIKQGWETIETTEYMGNKVFIMKIDTSEQVH